MSAETACRIPGRRILPAVLLLCVLALAVCTAPAGARSPTIHDIQPYDTVFVYEQNLDLTALRNATTDNPVTTLRKYQDDNPGRALVNDVNVPDDTDFDLLPIEVGDEYGVYFAFNPTDGNTKQILIREPTVFLDVVLANPYHADSVDGLTISPSTMLAFKIISPDVGAFYHTGNTYPATVDLVITSPGGGQSTIIGGRDMSGLNLTGSQVYTDDPGMPGAVSLSALKQGSYSVQARWNTPQEFADFAEDSNSITFNVGNRVGINTGTPTPTPAETTATPTPTATATAPPTTLPTTAATTAPTTVPATETTPATTPTQTPLSLFTVLGACAVVVFIAGRRD
ncbi:DUF3821 domain-containing protein [Methanoculleus sp. FWC-SCC1]|uniref:DUF3821 domain-containing protein n=1 Tax=Methanoculleus frigidifontis TaxID=2584085 RepID=A0ABT8MAE4_9EURY|nr:DUF3821 domain-containing protein [Methanoculleus sp. FWC-SCC1]MDN7024908.1 DUF3821 domain-containing protein [Methanoculleus sp. FWC-SCC1]